MYYEIYNSYKLFIYSTKLQFKIWTITNLIVLAINSCNCIHTRVEVKLFDKYKPNFSETSSQQRILKLFTHSVYERVFAFANSIVLGPSKTSNVVKWSTTGWFIIHDIWSRVATSHLVERQTSNKESSSRKPQRLLGLEACW